MKAKLNLSGEELEIEIYTDILIKYATTSETFTEKTTASSRMKDKSEEFPELTEADIDVLDQSGITLQRMGSYGDGAPRDLHDQIIRIEDELGVLTRKVVVKFNPDLSAADCVEIVKDLEMEPMKQLRFARNLYIVKPPSGLPTHMAAERMGRNPSVLYADPVLKRQSIRRWHDGDSLSATPLDASHQWQWPKISGQEAWVTSKGNGIRVAVIDRGFHPTHRLFSGGVNQTLSAWFDEDGNRSHDLNTMPKFYHGTFCSAQVAAKPVHATDVTGIAPEAELMLVSTPGKRDVFLEQVHLAIAVSYAARPSVDDPLMHSAGADIITCAEGAKSGQGKLENVLRDALDFVAEIGTPMIWAVANIDRPISGDELLSYPDLIRVGSSDEWGKVAPECAFGPELDFLAPGHWVVNFNGSEPKRDRGTSYAAPTAAGIAALVFSVVGGALTTEQLRKLMRMACEPIEGMNAGDRNQYAGSGVINAERAVQLAQQVQSSTLIL